MSCTTVLKLIACTAYEQAHIKREISQRVEQVWCRLLIAIVSCSFLALSTLMLHATPVSLSIGGGSIKLSSTLSDDAEANLILPLALVMELVMKLFPSCHFTLVLKIVAR